MRSRSAAKKISGMSLMELMVVVAISGGLALAVMSLMVDSTKISQQMTQQNEVSKDLQTFYFALEQYIGNVTQVVSCNCNASAPLCANHTAADSSPAGSSAAPNFRFVYEASPDPLVPATTFPATDCIYGNGSFATTAIAGTDIKPIGCKKVMDLRYTKETAGTPGKLELFQVEPPITDAGGNLVPLIFLNNVVGFACGMTVLAGPPSALSNNDFNVRIKLKAKTANFNEAADWTDDSKGIIRTHQGQILFRNLALPGIQFGKLIAVRGCTRVGNPPPGGDVKQCCSGYLSGANCSDPVGGPSGTPECVPNPNGATAPAGTPATCCSRMATGGKCI